MSATTDPSRTQHIYCDESHTDREFRVQGGIWVPDAGLRVVRAEFDKIRARHPRLREFKWGYVTGREPLRVYSELVELFFDSPAAEFLNFRCIVVAKEDDASLALDKVGRDVGFYKAYYTLLRHRLVRGLHYHVRLDGRSGPREAPEADLMRCLNTVARRDLDDPFTVLSCRHVVSHSEDLIQLADLFCGVVGWAWNGKSSTCGAKPVLHKQLCSFLPWDTLEARQTSKSQPKFNIWKYTPYHR